MATFVFLCPNEALKVQGFTAEEIGGSHIYETVICLACRSRTSSISKQVALSEPMAIYDIWR